MVDDAKGKGKVTDEMETLNNEPKGEKPRIWEEGRQEEEVHQEDCLLRQRHFFIFSKGRR
jgi:hypothetical protein